MPNTQPMVMDINGDQIMDVLYQPSKLAHFTGLTVALGTSDVNKYSFTSFFNSFVLSPTQDSTCGAPNTVDTLSIPHSGSFIDLDGDCKPDFLLTRTDGV